MIFVVGMKVRLSEYGRRKIRKRAAKPDTGIVVAVKPLVPGAIDQVENEIVVRRDGYAGPAHEYAESFWEPAR